MQDISTSDSSGHAAATSSVPSAQVKELTPLMRQYWQIKNEHPDKVLLFRMGDFYEMFYDDAKTAAPILNIALTSRNKKSEDETPMCGVPHHSIAGPIGKLLAAGHRVAICDQLEDPELAKGIVKRGVTRILSPGMVYDPESLKEMDSVFVAAFDDETLSFLESTTGRGVIYSIHSGGNSSQERLKELLALMNPVELVLSTEQKSPLGDQLNQILISKCERLETTWPDRFQKLPESALRLLTYTVDMQGVQALSAIQGFAQGNLSDVMTLGESPIRHLEIFTNYRGEDKGSLFHAINRTKTSAGSRKLKDWLKFPLTKKSQIEERLNRVEEWSKKHSDLKILRDVLGGMGDIERRLTKISYANCQVRDLLALSQSLRVGLQISTFCPEIQPAKLKIIEKLNAQIEGTIREDAPLNTKNGGFIREGINSELDEYIKLTEKSEELLLNLEQNEKSSTGISSLKIRYNNVFGYYIEVTNTHKEKVPDHYKRKQTLANAERYVTQELHELETKILSSRSKRVELEEAIFADLRQEVLKVASICLELAGRWSELDVISSFAWLSLEQNYRRPQFSSGDLELENSRHPVVEQEVKKTFVPNSLLLKSGECLLLTGPNMAGKSTLMRQVAVLSLMAQIGSFVPASKAILPIFTQIYTRIGASDSLSEGLSTFMVEMKETAEMLKGAGPNTLVVLDEVGRGTSTYDGMSLAQSILEYLVKEKRAMTLFATHYHEITQLAESYPVIKNGHMAVQEKAGDIRFLYILKDGPANKSYGIQVAKLAGLPKLVTERAAELLTNHEKQNLTDVRKDSSQSQKASTNSKEPSLFDFAEAQTHPLIDEIKTLNISEMTPITALNKLSQWQQSLS